MIEAITVLSFFAICTVVYDFTLQRMLKPHHSSDIETADPLKKDTTVS